MVDQNSPVLVGAAQLIQRDADPARAQGPLAMMEQVARDATADAAAGERVLADADTVGVIDVIAWDGRNLPRGLAERIGAKPAREYTTGIGGEIPLVVLNQVATEISAGVARVAVIAGCNNLATIGRARREGVELRWQTGGSGEPTLVGERTFGSSQREDQYGLGAPVSVYPVFENALRAHRGLDLASHQARMGSLMSRFSAVASKNPYAWFPTARSPAEISTPSATNRMIAFPYTKYLNAVIQTDQAAGVLMMSAAAARAYGIPEDRWVHWRGGAHCDERAWYASERPDFAACPALRAAAGGALDRAGIGIDDVDLIDFYSCFPVAVEMACEMLGIDEADPRGLTVTGGLPYAGGPGNNYTLHSLAAAMERLRSGAGRAALVTGNGWYLTKHSATVVSTEPGADTLAPGGAVEVGDVPGPVEIVDEASGSATLETYTLLYGRDGAPERGIAIGRLDDGRRFLANTPEDRDVLERFAAVENVGRRGVVSTRDGHNRFEPG